VHLLVTLYIKIFIFVIKPVLKADALNFVVLCINCVYYVLIALYYLIALFYVLIALLYY